MNRPDSSRSLRDAYLEWVEEQVEEYKDSVPRSELLRLADEVVRELETSRGGQYQLTELLLCDAVDGRIVKLLRLPGFRRWTDDFRTARREGPTARRESVRRLEVAKVSVA